MVASHSTFELALLTGERFRLSNDPLGSRTVAGLFSGFEWLPAFCHLQRRAFRAKHVHQLSFACHQPEDSLSTFCRSVPPVPYYPFGCKDRRSASSSASRAFLVFDSLPGHSVFPRTCRPRPW